MDLCVLKSNYEVLYISSNADTEIEMREIEMKKKMNELFYCRN